MEIGDPDKRALELIRKTEQTLAASQAEAEKKALALVSAARAKADRIIRQKEEELAHLRGQGEAIFAIDQSAPSDPAPADVASPQAAEKIARGLFARITELHDGAAE
ncbi:MAG: hypothetical protein OEV92_05390 [Nitrospinota bacterium]|nr:hypothetical protein [Nitrospinota bacterium]